MEKFDEISDKLKRYNQQHLLNFYDELNKEQRECLLAQISNIDFEEIEELFENTKKEIDLTPNSIEPLEYIDKYFIEKERYEEYFNIGFNAILEGKYAVVTMAGGQGTRLGHNGPKGTFELDLNGKKSIFEILSDILKTGEIGFGRKIPWYIMTSEENHLDTVNFFEQNNYFNYGKENIKFFMQGKLPMINTQGKLLLDNKWTIKEAADGHGGVFESMNKNNVIKDMKDKGIEWIYIGGVDNILAQMVDAFFIGVAIKENKVSAGKSVIKSNPNEKVGVFCKKDGKPSVIEYTEISEELKNKRNGNGELLFGESHILCNLFNIKILEKVQAEKLPYHIAFKRAKYVDVNGNIVEPTEPNAYKFESFIFDAFEDLDNMIIVRGRREEEFAPVKNAEGVDSPETAKKLYKDYHMKGEK